MTAPAIEYRPNSPAQGQIKHMQGRSLNSDLMPMRKNTNTYLKVDTQ